MFQPKITEINRHLNRQFSILWLVNQPAFNRLSTEFFFKNKKNCKNYFQNFFRFFFSKINRISTEFFFKYKKIAKIIKKNFLRTIFSTNFSFHKNFSAKIFFTIFSRISFAFDVCEIMYFAKLFIRNFANFFGLQFLCTKKKL